jgi:hypothetical protein
VQAALGELSQGTLLAPRLHHHACRYDSFASRFHAVEAPSATLPQHTAGIASRFTPLPAKLLTPLLASLRLASPLQRTRCGTGWRLQQCMVRGQPGSCCTDRPWPSAHACHELGTPTSPHITAICLRSDVSASGHCSPILSMRCAPMIYHSLLYSADQLTSRLPNHRRLPACSDKLCAKSARLIRLRRICMLGMECWYVEQRMALPVYSGGDARLAVKRRLRPCMVGHNTRKAHIKCKSTNLPSN